MAKYTFLCDKDDGGCGKGFILTCSQSDYDPDKRVTCPKCRKRKPVRRNFQADVPIHVGDSSARTIGTKADRNTAKTSVDERHHIHKKNNAYRDEGPLTELPKGMSRTRDKVIRD